jgi:hypothetical protein
MGCDVMEKALVRVVCNIWDWMLIVVSTHIFLGNSRSAVVLFHPLD